MFRTTVACIVFAVAAHAAPAAEFKKVTSEKGRFSAELPGEVTEKSEDVDGITVNVLTAKLSDFVKLEVVYYDEPLAKNAKDAQAFIKKLRRASYGRGASFSKEKEVTAGPRKAPGLDFLMKNHPEY